MAYRLEYASSARAGCKGGMPCKGTKIPKGELRIGTMVTIKENQTMAWRHWGCLTSRQITNIQKMLNSADEIDGFEDLRPADQEKVRKAWEDGHVDPADVPESAKKPEEEPELDENGDPVPKKKAPAKRKKKADDDDGADDAEEKPKKKRAPRKKKAETDEDEGAAEEAEEKPKKKRAAPRKKKAADEDAEDEPEVSRPRNRAVRRPRGGQAVAEPEADGGDE